MSANDGIAGCQARRGYEHIGAIVCDAGLQAGLNYRTVVGPRIDRLLRHWPTANTTTRFRRKADRYGLSDILLWRDTDKLERINALAALFAHNDVDTVEDARAWLSTATAEMLLLDVRGVGDKTVAYLRILAGLNDLAVDRHIRAFAAGAGVRGSDRQIKRRLIDAADACGLGLPRVDQVLWHHTSGSLTDTGAYDLRELQDALAR